MALRVPSLRSLQSNRGFALLITLTMLAFIVLMLVGLAAYTKVETSVAGNTQRQAQARENALLALNVAVGQLQKYAGVDTAITATAEGFGGRDGTRHYTGVWPSTYVPPALPEDPAAPAVTPTPEIPRTWLVSGNEFTKPDATEGAEPGATVPAPLEVTPSAPGSRLQVLVGSRSTATNNTRNDRWVEAPLVNLTATGVPGTSATTPSVIGRYAWWVGDQGVKAPVAVPIPENSVSHQFAQGGPGTGADGVVIFDPWAGANPSLVDGGRVGTFSQLAFLRTNGATQVGPASLRQNYHAWTTNNYAVLADTKRGGLRQDLSLDPSLLGDTFKVWSNYLDYMEPPQPPQPLDPSAPPPTTPVYTGPTIFPEYIEGITLRRRYWMVPQQAADGVAHSVAPVLNFFGLTISVHEDPNNAGEIEVSARCGVGLWNPYTSALLPEDLKIEIEGLPEILVQHSSTQAARSLNLTGILSRGNTKLTFSLPWVNTLGVPDTHSWLPGRVYNWAYDNTAPTPDTMVFHRPDQTAQTGTFDLVRATGIPFIVNPSNPVPPTRSCSLVNPGPVVLTVRVLRASDDAVLGEYTSPSFDFVTATTPLDLPDKSVDFGFVFRLPDLNDVVATGGSAQWLTTSGADPRESLFPASGFVVGGQGSDATQYGGLTGTYGFSALSIAGRLIEREQMAQTFDTDVPVFELPRTVFVSVGGLQHLHLPGARPFAIGNPWGSTSLIKGMTANSLFDRYFFSGLTDKVVPGTTDRGDILLPNFLLKPLRKPDHSKVTADDMRLTFSVPNTTDPTLPNDPSPVASRSSKFFLQSAAFNLNSTSAAAWASVLSAMRIPGGRGLNYLNASELTGTAADNETLPLASSAPHYFRFAQSAAETFRTGEDPSALRTSYFRKGVRELTSDQIGALATAIADRIKAKHNAADGAGGPFRSIEEFLTPFGSGVDADGNDIPATTVLEAAIAAANINLGVPEFSSQWLTQADIMSALAPTLFPRSDTFVIRTYGEALNPATGAIEGRAWCEAIVQRLPEYFADPVNFPPESLVSAFEPVPDPANPDVVPEPTEAQKLNKALGRRFKVVSFRWLTRADI